jgi:mannose-6-phosphate isomerase-like protein (cupin superfamily)
VIALTKATAGVTITPIPLVHGDERRSINEVEHETEAVRTTVLTIHGPATLGNHYHALLRETFTLISGSARLLVQDVNMDGQPIGETEEHELTAPAIVVVPPFTGHLFHFEGPAILVCHASRLHNEADLIPFKLA